ncbi:ABC transporter permease [Rhodococcus opacus]|uniref:ABC transporter permease n=1 Tax=Rhodococcus opacus TaxID=37919 RepID=UPI002476E817|nr:ABC transporter permease [Rhodococcus opacus]MDH6292437.1 ribose transport system permease protein [Rhodococcus opacus]
MATEQPHAVLPTPDVDTARVGAGTEAPSPGPEFVRHTNKRDTRKLIRDYGILGIFVVLFAVLSFAAPNFLTAQNLLNVLNSNAYIGIVACGTTLVMIGGNFDLSVGTTYALAGILGAWLTVNIGSPIAGLIVAVLVVGVGIGLTNAVLVNVVRIHSFLATLATSLVLSGIALAITDGFQISIPADKEAAFTWIGQGASLFGIPNPVTVFVVVAAVLAFVLARTRFGRYIYAAGGNPEAARLSGIRVGWIITATLVVGGLCAALAGIIGASLAGAGQANPGGTQSLPLDAIAAVVIGGTSIKGGEGALWRTVIGVLFIALINNAFNLIGVDSAYLPTTTGLLIIVAVAANSFIVDRRSAKA